MWTAAEAGAEAGAVGISGLKGGRAEVQQVCVCIKLYQPLPSSWSERRLLLPCKLTQLVPGDGSRQPQIKHVDDACGHVAYNDVGLKVEWSAEPPAAAGFEPNKHHN